MTRKYFKYGKKEIAHLAERDPVLGAAMEKIGPIRREVQPDLFAALTGQIISQQISTKGAVTIWRRLEEKLGAVTPETVARASTHDIQRCGTSTRKATYIRELALGVLDGSIDLGCLSRLSDEEVCLHLAAIKGIGVWTAEMLMTFSMQRPDIMSWGDIAIHRGLRMLYRHRRITKKLFDKYRRRYSPHASVACLYLWEIAGGGCEGLSDPAPLSEAQKKNPPPDKAKGSAGRPFARRRTTAKKGIGMKMISWNVNGLRACLGKGFLDSMRALDPDVICLQETKMQKGQADVDLPGYTEMWNSAEKKGYSGTAIFSKTAPISERQGLGDILEDREGRVITAEYEAFYLVNVYTPNSQQELARLDYRMEWDDAFRAYLQTLDKKKPVITCGDLNVAHQEIDIRNPKTNHRNAGFTDEERGKMTELLGAGFIDTFRTLHPDEKDAYSWWSFRANARARNIGWRIDYFLASERLRERVAGAAIHPAITGSDHCPVELVLSM